MVGCGLWNGVAKFDRVDATLPGGGGSILPPPPRGPALTRRCHPRVFSSGDDDGRPGGRTTREGDSGAEGGLVTSLPTIRPLGWMRCRHDARMGTSSSFGVGVPYGASNVVACSASGDMMYGAAGSLLR